MWKILKTQILYNKLVLIGCFLFSLAVIIPFIVQDWQDIEKSYPALRAVLFAMTIIVFFSSFVRNVKEKRERFFNNLPISILRIGFQRLLYTLLFWICLMILVVVAFLIRPSIFNAKILMDLLSQTGFIFGLIGLIFIIRDMSYVLIIKKLKRLIGVLNFIVILLGYLLFMLFIVSKSALDNSPSLIPLKDGFNQFITSSAGSVVFMIIGIATCLLSLYVYTRRKTFLE